MYNFDFTDRYILITGAAGAIGQVLARCFAESNANLILTDLKLKEKDLNFYSKKLGEKYSIETRCFYFDLSEVINIKEFSEELQKYKVPDVLINNAGQNIIKPAFDITEQDWDSVVDVNLKANFFLSKYVAKLAVKNSKPLIIVNIASQHAIVGNENRAPYCSSKAGIVSLTRALTSEWSKHGIRINSISPSVVETVNNNELIYNKKFVKKFLDKTPLKRYALPEDIAYASLYLSSDYSKMITGSNLVIDGGYTSI